MTPSGGPVVAIPAELLEDPRVELVVVAAPNAVHYELAARQQPAGAGGQAAVSRT